MKLIVYSASQSFKQFLNSHTELAFEHCAELHAPSVDQNCIHLLHISTLGQPGYAWLKQFTLGRPIKVGICSDLPNISEMLECVQLGAKAYCNSYMTPILFNQMIQLLNNNQSWFPPHMLEQTFKLAHQAANPAQTSNSLEPLTAREKQIALAVAEGKSNKQIASQFGISDRTVKTHLTNIFRKLDLKDRVALVLYLKAS